MSQKKIWEDVEKPSLKSGMPDFRAGDVVRVLTKVKEGSRERIQAFEGMVIQRKNAGIRATFTVRKVSFGVGVERIFPLHSPRVDKIELVKTGRVRKSRLYYMRDRTGKQSRLRERETGPEAMVAVAGAMAAAETGPSVERA